nr:tectonin domain-containing protein [Propionicimonas sp.]
MENFYHFNLRGIPGDQTHMYEMVTGEWSRVLSVFTKGNPARDIAIGPDGQVWVLMKAVNTGDQPDDGVDFELRWYNGYAPLGDQSAGWDLVPGGAGVAVTADEEGRPWVCRASGEILRRLDDGSWQTLPGSASDLSVGANGAAWAVGTKDVDHGHEILRWTGQDWEEVPAPTGAVRIAVSPSGEPWIANSRDQIFRYLGGRWYRVMGSAIDLAFGADGNLWIASAHGGGQGGCLVYHWNGREWDKIDGAAVRIAVMPNGMPWLVNIRGHVYPRVLNH